MIDFSLLMLLLRKHGMTTKKIAKAVGIGESQAYDLCSGKKKEPKFTAALRLIDLAYDVLPPHEFERVRA